MKRPLRLRLLAITGLLSLVAGPGLARADATPFHRCVDAALAQKPGKVLEVELETEGGKELYEIEIAGTDGKTVGTEVRPGDRKDHQGRARGKG